MNYIGIDIGKKSCAVCIMKDDSTITEETKYDNSLEQAESFAVHVTGQYGACTAVCESTGNLWIKTYEALEKHGIAVKLANPVKTRAIAEAQIKTDTLDARTLAHLLRSNLVAECYIAPSDTREDRTLLRQRTSLVHDRTRIINRIRSLLDKYDLRCGYDRIYGVNGIKWLKSLRLASANDNTTLHQHTRHIEFLNHEIEKVQRDIAASSARNEAAAILMSINGIDYYSAMVIVSEIGEISRFGSPKKLVSWAGLCPSIHQSGDSLYLGKMKDGNKRIRWILTEAANIAARTDDRFKQFYLRKVKRHGHNIAISHLANKMLVIIWHMLTEKKLYHQRKEELYDKKLKRLNKLIQ